MKYLGNPRTVSSFPGQYLSCFLHFQLLSDKLAGFDGLDGPPAHIAIAPMRPLVVVAGKTLIQACLVHLQRCVELLMKESVQSGPIEPLREVDGDA